MKILGDNKISDEALVTMRSRGGDWYAYQNMALDSAGLGDLQFLQCGPDCTFKEPPARMPDTPRCINWKFLLVGVVDLQQGQIREAM